MKRCIAVVWGWWALVVPAASMEHITVIGDSLTKEYQITFPGLPPLVSGLDPTNPAARNWAEVLNERRNAHFDLGEFKNSLFFNRWADLRLLGHEYNWAVPGVTSRAIRNLVTNQNLDEITGDPDFSIIIDFAPEWNQSAARLTTQVQTSAAAAVVWCGANDLRYGNSDPATHVGGESITYDTIYAGDGTGLGNPQPLMDSIKASIQAVAQHVRTARPGLPLAVCAVPHIGCTPAVQATAPTDPVRTGRITTALRALNAELKTWTESTIDGVWIDTLSLTEDLIGSDRLLIGGVAIINASSTATGTDPAAAHNRFVFSRDGFHPGTPMHAIVAQRVQAALKGKAPDVFGDSPDLTDREIIVNVLGLAADSGFNEFMLASGAPTGQRGPADDPDGDGLLNIGEFSLADNTPFPGGPLVLPTAGIAPIAATVTLQWRPRSDTNVFATITCQSSPDFLIWSDVPAAQITTAADGTRTAHVPTGGHPHLFLRLKFTTTP